jgi:heterodisulfide reductase subunit C
MPIHEVSLIRPENLKTHEKLVMDGVDVSGHWSTFIESRVVTDYNEALEEEISALPGGEHIHRCWQCGSCTNSCTVNAVNPDFNPRYWIYLIRLGMESELLRDKDIIWQCVSCNKCTYACPRDVFPEVFATGKIEEGRVIRGFFARTGQPLRQEWLIEMARRLARKMPVLMGMRMALSAVFRPRTRNWARTGAAIGEYVAQQEAKHKASLSSGSPPGQGSNGRGPERGQR